MKRNLATIDTDMFTPIGRLLQQAMAHGIVNDMIYGGLEVGQTALQALTVAQTTKNCLVGTRRVSWDGCVHRYNRVTATFTSLQYGVKFWDELGNGIGYIAPAANQAAGTSVISVVTANGMALNELVGGYIIVYVPDAQGSHQFRTITGNTLAAPAGTTIISVDEPWNCNIVVATDYVEVCRNPYDNLRMASSGKAGCGTANEYTSVAGMPRALVTVANYYSWIKTWGPHRVNPHGTAAATVTADRRGLVFDREGSISAIDESVSADVAQQYAGFIINRESVANGTGPPLVMLQICP